MNNGRMHYLAVGEVVEERLEIEQPPVEQVNEGVVLGVDDVEIARRGRHDVDGTL